jgi:hypothetical protein
VLAGVYDISGRRVRRVADGTFEAGEHLLRWDGDTDASLAAAPGVYFLRVQVNGRGVHHGKVVRID